jgi:predicted nucleotidyltransferase
MQIGIANITLPHNEIAEFCRKWNVSEFALFGSVLRDDFRLDSDVDVLVSFPSYEATPSLFDHVEMQDELVEMFGRPVDLLTRGGVEDSRNPIRRQAILETARVIYAHS